MIQHITDTLGVVATEAVLVILLDTSLSSTKESIYMYIADSVIVPNYQRGDAALIEGEALL